MTIHAQIQKDSVMALKEKDSERRAALSFLASELKKVAKDSKLEELDDARAVSILQKQLKQRHETLDAATKANREDLAKQAKYEIDLISAYLPVSLSEEETKTLAAKVISELGALSMKDMGKVMNQALKEAPAADKSKLSAIVKTLLAGK